MNFCLKARVKTGNAYEVLTTAAIKKKKSYSTPQKWDCDLNQPSLPLLTEATMLGCYILLHFFIHSNFKECKYGTQNCERQSERSTNTKNPELFNTVVGREEYFQSSIQKSWSWNKWHMVKEGWPLVFLFVCLLWDFVWLFVFKLESISQRKFGGIFWRFVGAPWEGLILISHAPRSRVFQDLAHPADIL